MRALSLTSIVIVLAVVAAGHPAAAQASATFEKALLLEEAQAQLGKAISLYEQTVKESSDPGLRARAQLHIGICYEKLGREEARRAYQKVINDYPSQAATVAAARERLAAIRLASRAADRDSADLVLQQLWPDPPDTEGGPSPDGRYISYVDWSRPAIGVYDLKTGASRVLDATAGTWDGDHKWPEFPVWSPDGNHLAYVSWRGPLSSQVSWGQEKLIIRNMQKGEERVLTPRLQQLNKGKMGYPRWSPDGRQLVIGGRAVKGPAGEFVVDVGSGEATRILDHTSALKIPVWSKSGKSFYYAMAGKDEAGGVYAYQRTTKAVTRLAALRNARVPRSIPTVTGWPFPARPPSSWFLPLEASRRNS